MAPGLISPTVRELNPANPSGGPPEKPAITDAAGAEELSAAAEFDEAAQGKRMAPLDDPLQLPYDPRPVQDRWRGIVAVALLFILLLTLAMPWVAFLRNPDQIDGIKEILSLVLAPVAGLVGAATAFYFSEKPPGASGTGST